MAIYSETVKKILRSIDTNILPTDTSVTRRPVNKVGITHFTDHVQLKFDHPTATEKTSTTTKYGFPIDDSAELYWPHHVKEYNVPSVGEVIDRILVSSVLEAAPVPLETYAVSFDRGEGVPTFVSSSAIDLNSLLIKDENIPVKTIRLDRLLSACGYKGAYPDLHSFADIQEFINNPKVNQLLSPRAIVQVVLASYFIPNAIGETDANSRNIILADTTLTGKYDVAFRIDAESNTYIRDKYNERSGKKRVPKGIHTANEELDEYLMNIKNRTHGNVDIDWELFAGFLDLTEYFVSRSTLDDAISNRGYKRNQFRYDPSRDVSEGNYVASARRLSADAYGDFSEATITRAKNFMHLTKNALGGLVHPKYINDAIIDEPRASMLETAYYDKKGHIFDRNGNIISPEKFSEKQPGMDL